MMPKYDFRCQDGHAYENLVPYEERNNQVCPICGAKAKVVWLTTPNLDWMGIGAQANASPEFIDRFEKAHKQRREQEEAHKREHGDALRGAGG